jgi:hypothetical protein
MSYLEKIKKCQPIQLRVLEYIYSKKESKTNVINVVTDVKINKG